MNVLVVDDDAGARALVRRVLVRDFNVQVAEADDGVTGLEHLLARPVDLLLLDIRMKVMDGLRTLEAVRRSPNHGSLRVVMLTGLADEERVTRAMSLGVRDFILKPLTQGILRERLLRVIGEVRQKMERGGPSMLDLKATDRVVMADQDATFRDFFRSTLTCCQVDEADSEITALKAVQSGPVAALFVGSTQGLLEPKAFIQTWRNATQPRHVPVVALVPSGDLEATRGSGVYDAALARGFDTVSFTWSLTQLLSEQAVARMLFHTASSCVATLVATACKTLSGPLQDTITDTSLVDLPAASHTTRWLSGTVSLQSAQSAWELRLHLPFGVALQVAAVARRVKADGISESQVIEAARDTMELLGTHLRDEAIARGLHCRLGQPTAGFEVPTAVFRSLVKATGVARCLMGAGAAPVGVLQLMPRSGDTASH